MTYNVFYFHHPSWDIDCVTRQASMSRMEYVMLGSQLFNGWIRVSLKETYRDVYRIVDVDSVRRVDGAGFVE